MSDLGITLDVLSKSSGLLGLGVTTFLAAWAGGWAAFNTERNTRATAQRSSQISAANRALFKIGQMYHVYENIRKYCIDKDGARNDPRRVFSMDSPQPGLIKDITFNFDELSYFLDHPGDLPSQTLMDMQVFDWGFQVLRSTVDARAKALEELREAMRKRPLANATFEVFATHYHSEYSRAMLFTDQLIRVVDEGRESAKVMYGKMNHALQVLFPRQNFLQVNFAKEPGTNTGEK